MKQIIFTMLCMTFFIVSASAQPLQGSAKRGMVFGQKTVENGAIDVNKLSADIKEGVETPVKVKGKVVDVCTKEGCWLKMQTSDGTIIVKMRNHGFNVPVDLNGKEIVVAGSAKKSVTSVRELQHYAEDANKTKEEIDAIKKPKTEVVLNADGIIVL